MNRPTVRTALIVGAAVIVYVALAWAALAVGAMAPDLDGGGLVSKPSAWVPEVVPVDDHTGQPCQL